MPYFRSFATAYTQRDFPLSYKLRQDMYLQGMVNTEDNRLSITAQKCFATPTPNENDVKAYTIIDNGLVDFEFIEREYKIYSRMTVQYRDKDKPFGVSSPPTLSHLDFKYELD